MSDVGTMNSIRNPNTKINDVRENIQSEYSEELKLNIRCENDDNHIAVLYCIKCEASLCRMCSDTIHSSRALSNHEIVRLTQKPEPPINCYLHLDKTAELICKEPSCEGVNKPICTICHQYQTHKNHKFEMIEDEFNTILTNITECLDEIEKNQKICERSLEEYDKCISSYSITDPGFIKNDRDKVDKFYSDLRTSALKKFDDFVNDRIEKLNLSKNRYQSEKVKLDNMSSKLRNMKEMKKVEVIKSGENVKNLMVQAEKSLEKPTDLLPSKCYDITISINELTDIQIDLCENYQLHIQSKTPAVYIINSNGSHIFVMNYCSDTGIKNELKEKMNIKWWSGIVVLIDFSDWDKKMEYVDRIREIAKTDNRVEVIRNDSLKRLLDSLLEK